MEKALLFVAIEWMWHHSVTASGLYVYIRGNQYVDRDPQVTGNTVGRVDFRHNVQRAGFCF